MNKIKDLLLGVIIGMSITILCYEMLPCHVYKQEVSSMHEYQLDVNWDSITVYDGPKVIGTVKMEGQLDSLIIEDNR